MSIEENLATIKIFEDRVATSYTSIPLYVLAQRVSELYCFIVTASSIYYLQNTYMLFVYKV